MKCNNCIAMHAVGLSCPCITEKKTVLLLDRVEAMPTVTPIWSKLRSLAVRVLPKQKPQAKE